MSAPTNLAGYIDDTGALEGFATAIDYLLEQIPDLIHPQSVITYARMRHEPQLSSILRVYLLSMERAHWSLDPAGCRDEVVARMADDFGLPIKGYTDGDPDPDDPDAKVMKPTGARRRRFSWAKHLRVAAPLSLTFGHAPFAQEWEPGADRLFRLKMVQERMPQTIANIRLNADGTLAGAQQNGVAGQSSAPTITTANHQLVWYAREQQGSNYFGESLLRPSYPLWMIKTELMRVWPTSNRRNGMGIWQVQAPPGATQGQILEAQRLAARTRASENAGIGLPAGFSAELKGMTGSLPNHKELADYLDRQMTRSTLTSILDMATAERGSRSLGETVMQLMIYAQQAEADRVALDATEQMVIPLVDANWGEDEPAPQICVEDVGIDDQLTAQDINWLLQYGGLTPDDTLEEDLRKRKHLPPIDHDTRRLEITTLPPVDPDATETEAQ